MNKFIYAGRQCGKSMFLMVHVLKELGVDSKIIAEILREINNDEHKN